jgi:hypothetical protein
LNTWGIYNKKNIDNCDTTVSVYPFCDTCSEKLVPWISHCTHSYLAFCKQCKKFFLVKSVFEPLDQTHIKEEKTRLVSYEILELKLQIIPEIAELLWDFHEKIPLKKPETTILLEELKNISSHKTNEEILFSHIVFSLLFNSASINKSIIVSYFELILKNSNYKEIINEHFIWLGDEYDIAVFLEKNYYNDLNNAFFEVWKLYGKTFSIKEFKEKIGIFAPISLPLGNEYNTEFIGFIKNIGKRIN